MGNAPQGENHEYLTPALKSGYLWPHHRKMARLAISGCTPGEIATVTGFTEGAISRILATPAFQAEVARLEGMSDVIATDIRLDIERMAANAIEILDEDMNMEINNRFERKLRQDAAKDILDRAGYRKKSEPSIHLHAHEHRKVKEMSTDELRDSVFDLIKTGDGDYA